MALETLKGVTSIGGFPLIDLEEAKSLPELNPDGGPFDWGKYDEMRKDFPIAIAHNINTISFRIQKGPIKEVGVNGCQIDTLLETARHILEGFNQTVPCKENTEAIVHIGRALRCLEARREDRERREVEGTGQL